MGAAALDDVLTAGGGHAGAEPVGTGALHAGRLEGTKRLGHTGSTSRDGREIVGKVLFCGALVNRCAPAPRGPWLCRAKGLVPPGAARRRSKLMHSRGGPPTWGADPARSAHRLCVWSRRGRRIHPRRSLDRARPGPASPQIQARDSMKKGAQVRGRSGPRRAGRESWSRCLLAPEFVCYRFPPRRRIRRHHQDRRHDPGARAPLRQGLAFGPRLPAGMPAGQRGVQVSMTQSRQHGHGIGSGAVKA